MWYWSRQSILQLLYLFTFVLINILQIPRLEGYSEIVRTIADEYGNMSLIEFDGYFEGKLEPVKYTRVEVHTDEVDEEKIISFADKIRIKLRQTSLAYEFNNRLVLISQ